MSKVSIPHFFQIETWVCRKWIDCGRVQRACHVAFPLNIFIIIAIFAHNFINVQFDYFLKDFYCRINKSISIKICQGLKIIA